MTKRLPRISAVICTHNRAWYLRQALRSLLVQTLGRDEFDVIVVDNASTDDTAEVVESMIANFHALRYVYEEHLGLSWARNTGAAVSAAPYVAYLDDDARAEPGWLECIMRAFEEVQPAPAAVGGPVWLDWGGPPPPWLPQRYWSIYTYVDHGNSGHFLDMQEYLVGANMAFRRDVLMGIAGFDTNLGRQGSILLSGEEAAVLQRIRDRHLPMYYEPGAAVWHAVPDARRRRRWFWSRMFWDGASQPFLDYGGHQTRQFYLMQSYQDVRRMGFFSREWLRALTRGDRDALTDNALALTQRVGRLRSNTLLARKVARRGEVEENGSVSVRDPAAASYSAETQAESPSMSGQVDSESLHICFLSLDYPSSESGGGVGTQVRSLGQALVQAGHRVTVVTLGSAQEEAHQVDGGIHVFRFLRGNIHWYLSKLPFIGSILARPVREIEDSWAAYRLVRRQHQREPFDLVEATETGSLLVALAMPKVPLAIRLHGEPYTFYRYAPDVPLTAGIRLSRLLQRMALQRADALISPSHAHARTIATELSIDVRCIEVIPNTLPARITDAESTNCDDDATSAQCEPSVLYVGRIEPSKGVLVLLEAAHDVVRAVPNADFVLAGATHPTLPVEQLHNLIEAHEFGAHICLAGHLPWEQLAGWYRRALICALPSYYETFGLAALEPMGFGVPVVATTAGGLPEVVEDGVTGILVPPGDHQALAQAIICLLRDPSLRRRMGKAGRERAVEHFTVESILDRTVAYYRTVAGRSGGPHSSRVLSRHVRQHR